jgi:anhydro-N-acetylmuramic acid kinase
LYFRPMAGQEIIYGLMSGTSLDGVDIAACSFSKEKTGWDYNIIYAATFPYKEQWKKSLRKAPLMNGEDLIRLDREYGNYLGGLINTTINQTGIKPDLIASHGHTIYHQPGLKFTLQIGSGANIAATTGIPVVCDFRSTDVALGGQGAPLVPIGDRLLFSEYTACLNLGGFANISFEHNGERIAFDICPVNIILNALANLQGVDYDRGGEMGKNGKCNVKLYNELNSMSFYHQEPPKSLSREWLQSEFDPKICECQDATVNIARTCYEHIGIQTGEVLARYGIDKVLLTGGGVHNTFLLEILKKNFSGQFIIPEPELVDFKEALIFALMGLLRYRNQINCLASVTGAKSDSISGAVYVK